MELYCTDGYLSEMSSEHIATFKQHTYGVIVQYILNVK
jgi:hypothetical protein